MCEREKKDEDKKEETQDQNYVHEEKWRQNLLVNSHRISLLSASSADHTQELSLHPPNRCVSK